MKITKRMKTVWAVLAIYWPVLFVLTHVPILDVARKSGMSDKLMHVLAYMGLMMLVWWAVSPYERVDWRRWKVWLILAVVVWYGAADEWLQGYVGRSADMEDFVADLIGTLAGLVLLWALPFWPAVLVVTAVFIFCVSDLSRLDLLARYAVLNTGFQFGGYAVFTLAWIHSRGRFREAQGRAWSWLVQAVSLPLALLGFVKLAAWGLGKPILWPDCAAATAGMVLAAGASWLLFRARPMAGPVGDTAADHVAEGSSVPAGSGGVAGEEEDRVARSREYRTS